MGCGPEQGRALGAAREHLAVSLQDAGSQQVGFLLGSCGVTLALTTDACQKGLPKAQTGEVATFKGRRPGALRGAVSSRARYSWVGVRLAAQPRGSESRPVLPLARGTD